MKRVLLWLLMLGMVGSLSARKIYHKPYLLHGTAQGELAAVAQKLEEGLAGAGFELLGRYTPGADEGTLVLTMTHPHLRAAADKVGGYGLLGLGFRVALRKVEKGIEITSQNPPYWANAYMQKAYRRVEREMKAFAGQLEAGVRGVVPGKSEGFGHRKGLTEKKLRKYHYMILMPYLKDSVQLAGGAGYSYEATVARIEEQLEAGVGSTQKVFRIDSDKHKATLFGIGLLDETTGEPNFLPIIDFGEPRHISAFPYEILVTEKRAICLHGRYRIALSFPSLTMSTFTKIMSTPGDIEAAMRRLVEPPPETSPEGK